MILNFSKDYREELFETEYKFYCIENKTNSSKLLYVLAGYKPLLWDNVFERIKLFTPEGIDVCLISSGRYCSELEKYASRYHWVYLSTERNKLTIAQNIGLREFSTAEWICKIDEDIFVTKDFFSILMDTYIRLERENYVGAVGPLIPINNIGMHLYMKEEGIDDVFYQQYSNYKRKFGGGMQDAVMYSDEMAEFFWLHCKQIDFDASKYRLAPFKYFFTPIGYYIGVIMYKRNLWMDMGMFDVGEGNGGGADQDKIIAYCSMNSKVIAIGMNSLCFHFGFYNQEGMLYTYYRLHKEKFAIEEC